MRISLPVISSGLNLGTIQLQTGEIGTDGITPIVYSCENSTNCCRGMRIPVSDFDIDRIMDHGFELDQIIESASPILIPSKNPSGKREKVYILKKKPFENSCTFLEDNMCTIHSFKPFACRIFPFELEFLDNDWVRMIVHNEFLCHSIKGTVPDEAINVDLLSEVRDMILKEMLDRGITFDE